MNDYFEEEIPECAERCRDIHKIAYMLQLKQQQVGCKFQPGEEEAFSNLGHAIPGCRFGYRNGDHPDKTDAQIAAEQNGKSKQIPGNTYGATNSSKKKSIEKKTDKKPEQKVIKKLCEPNKRLKPDYKVGEKAKDANRLADVLLAEAEPDEMEYVAASVINRYQTPDGGFDTKKPKNYSEVINANGHSEQYAGFGGGAESKKAKKIREDAKNGDPIAKKKLAKANEIATKAINDPDSIKRTIKDKDGKERYIYGLRTKGKEGEMGKKESRYKKIELEESDKDKKGKELGNTYFYLEK